MLKVIREYLGEKIYNVGFIESANLSISPNVKWLNLTGYKGGWFADPFVLSETSDTIEILVEEFLYSIGRGRLSIITVEKKNYTLQKVEPILELPTHLSYPIPFFENGDIYIYPENYESGSLKAYKFDSRNRTLSNPFVLIDEPLLDTQIIKLNDSYYALGVKFKTGKQHDTKELYIYKASSFRGPYSLHQTLTSDRCDERGAGLIFTNDDIIIRPTQDCEGDYGRGVILKQLIIKEGMFIQKEILRIYPNKSAGIYKLGLHTYSKTGSTIVIDGRGYRHGISRLLRNTLNLLKKWI